MNNKKFKTGDRVKIIDASSIELYELNKIGVIVGINDWGNGLVNHVVDMGRPRREQESEKDTCWWLRAKHIELVNQPNEQLLFDFMYEE